MSALPKICLTLFFLIRLSLVTRGETVTVYVANIPIALPAPEGFFRCDGKSTKVDRMQQSLIGASNRLLASFGSEDDLAQTLKDTYPKLERNFNAQSVKKFEEVSVTSAGFTDLKTTLRTSMDSTRQKLGDMFAEIESSASSTLSKDLQTRTDLKVGEMIPLGVFDETPDSISFSMLTKYRLTAEDRGKPVEGVSIVAACALNLRNRVINLYCTSDYRDKRDIEWARSNVKKWRDEVLAMNGATASSIPSSVPSTSYSPARSSSLGSVVEREVSKKLVAVIVSAIFAVIAGFITLLKKRS